MVLDRPSGVESSVRRPEKAGVIRIDTRNGSLAEAAIILTQQKVAGCEIVGLPLRERESEQLSGGRTSGPEEDEGFASV